ncbi:anti-sigma factor [Metabacillus idriensis]|uniref:anti sigma factor C-terminal domain-containing protein n=1 Tax=Metabacillus idriensis TaxID=324768 RepID=UPI00203C5B8C|nr:anti sigma factor C-terminal domain-containing protein [Metabacillus idriensis]MCM3597209.1 anti-sigma factor [Metabacillus idriensis]
MSDKHDSNNVEDIDFLSSPSMQKAIKKTKRKQTIKYVIISVLTMTILLTVVINGSQYLMNKRIEKEESTMFDTVHGANIHASGGGYNYDLFSVTSEKRYRKTIGDRTILWDIKRERIPLFGRKETLESGNGMVEVNSLNKSAQRYVRYNDLNNERKIDFYYPKLSYDFLPNELELVNRLNENMLVEVALSFNEPMTIAEASRQLGHDNVNWLWVDTTTVAQMKRMEKELDSDNNKTKGGGGAFGFDVNPDFPYSDKNEQFFMDTMEQLSQSGSHKGSIREALKGIEENTQSTNGMIRINGAVVTGTPKKIQRFQKMEFIRASVLGATIDKY